MSERGVVVINGMAVDVPALQQRLVSGRWASWLAVDECGAAWCCG